METNLKAENSSISSLNADASISGEGIKPNTSKLPEINANVLLDIEREACSIAKDFYKLNKQLQISLNHISAASVCCLQTYQDSINRLCDSVDECVKEDDLLLKKANELSRTMEPIYKLQEKINSIKIILTNLETQI